MRALADSTRIQEFMKALVRAADLPAQVYLTGGTSTCMRKRCRRLSGVTRKTRAMSGNCSIGAWSIEPGCSSTSQQSSRDSTGIRR